MTRTEHVRWCKDRALEYITTGDLNGAFASMMSDLGKHAETEGHCGIKLGASLLFSGNLNTADKMQHFIEGFN